MRGNRTATAALRPQTGFEDRPGHQAHAFRGTRKTLIYRLTVTTGEDPDVADTPGNAGFISVL